MRQTRPQPVNGPALQAAFALLHEVVRDFEVTGRLPLTTGVKPEMQHRSGGQFQEQTLGFATFGEFVQAAVQNGVVALLDHEKGRLLHVEGVVPRPRRRLPTAPPAPAKAAEKQVREVRSDLWRAFIDWRSSLRRLWDKQAESAVIFLAESAGGTTSQDDAVREAVAAMPDRFVEITPIPQDTQLQWIRSFVHDLDDPKLRDSLLLLLGTTNRPFAAFGSMLRGMPAIQQAWQAHRRELVVQEISRWARDHGLAVDPFADSATEQGSEQPTEQAPPLAESGLNVIRNEVETRRMYHSAIDRMPYEDLLRLPIPLVYLLDGSESA